MSLARATWLSVLTEGIVRLGAVQGLGYLGQVDALATRVPYGGETEVLFA